MLEDDGGGIASRFRSPQVKSVQGRAEQASRGGVNDLGRKCQARSCERSNQLLRSSHARVPMHSPHNAILFFSLHVAPLTLLSLSLSLGLFRVYSIFVRSPRRSSFLINTRSDRSASDDDILTEITNSLVTNNFHSATIGDGVTSYGLWSDDRHSSHTIGDI